MVGQPPDEALLAFFKALADANRLKIVGLLAREACTVEQLAAILRLRPSTVSHHLARLRDAGLVSAAAEGYYSRYRLEADALTAMAERLLSPQVLPAIAADVDATAYDRKVLADFSLADGRLKVIPAQHKKLQAVLRHVANAFDIGQRYRERQVNDILRRFHADVATLRRELVGAALLRRERGVYWRETSEGAA